MNFLNFDIKKIVVLCCLALLPLVSINNQRNPLNSEWFNRPFSFVASQLQSSVFSFSEAVRTTTRKYIDLIGIKNLNAELLLKNQELLARLSSFEELQVENNALRKLLDFKANSKMDLVAAEVMSRDLLADHNTLQISKGTDHGLKNGQAVITAEGVVGYVFRPQAKTSQVMLITDRYAVVDGLVARSRARGIVEGKSQTHCSFQYVEKSEDVVVGDIIVTSGLDGIFPKGFPVAVVESVENKTYAVSLKVDLRPFVNPDKVERVFVILNSNEQDFSEPAVSVGSL